MGCLFVLEPATPQVYNFCLKDTLFWLLAHNRTASRMLWPMYSPAHPPPFHCTDWGLHSEPPIRYTPRQTLQQLLVLTASFSSFAEWEQATQRLLQVATKARWNKTVELSDTLCTATAGGRTLVICKVENKFRKAASIRPGLRRAEMVKQTQSRLVVVVVSVWLAAVLATQAGGHCALGTRWTRQN